MFGPDRHKDDGCSVAFNKWWGALTLRGDPARRGNLSGEAFEAGWGGGHGGSQRG